MNIKQIQSFVAVADTKSFSEAANLMYTSVSQISKLVKGLEDELGNTLFERKKSGIILTIEGMRIYNIANKVLRDMDEFELIKEKNGKESLVILGLPDVYMDNVFIDYINMKKENDYFYNLSNRSIENICTSLHVRRADAGFAYIDKRRKTAIKMGLNNYALRFTPIANTRKYLFVNPSHKLAKNRRIEFSQLENTKQIKINGTDFLKAEQIKSSYVSIFSKPLMKMLTYSFATAINTVKNTDMAYIGCDIFNLITEDDNIRKIPFAEGFNEVEFGYIKRHNIDLSEAAEDFIEHIKGKISK